MSEVSAVAQFEGDLYTVHKTLYGVYKESREAQRAVDVFMAQVFDLMNVYDFDFMVDPDEYMDALREGGWVQADQDEDGVLVLADGRVFIENPSDNLPSMAEVIQEAMSTSVAIDALSDDDNVQNNKAWEEGQEISGVFFD